MANTNLTISKLPRTLVTTQKPVVPSISLPTAVPQLPSSANTLGRRLREQERYQKQQEEAQMQEAISGFGGKTWDYNNPYVINSISDAIFNREGKAKRYGEWAKIPVIGDIASAFVAMVDLSAQSVYNLGAAIGNTITGDWDDAGKYWTAFGVNTLTNVTETLDILANPVKSLIAPLVNDYEADDPRSSMTIGEHFLAGLGVGEQGRYNYDYDTGFFLSDIGLEIISDPINLITAIISFGTAPAAKAAVTSGVKAGAKAGLSMAVEEGAEAAIKKAASLASKRVSNKIITRTVDSILSLKKSATKVSALTKRAAKATGNTALRDAAGTLDIALTTGKHITDDGIKAVTDIANQVKTIIKDLDTAAPGYSNTIKVLEDLSKQADDVLKNDITYGDFLKQIHRPSLTREATKKVKELKGRLAKASKALSEATTDNVDAASLKNLQDTVTQYQNELKVLFSEPGLYKKYKGIDWNATIEEVADNVQFRDVMHGVNTLLQNSRSFKVMQALDKLTTVTEAVDRALLKSVLGSNAATMSIYITAKLGGFRKLGSWTTRFAMKSLQDVADWMAKRNPVQQTIDLFDSIDLLKNNKARLSLFSDA